MRYDPHFISRRKLGRIFTIQVFFVYVHLLLMVDLLRPVIEATFLLESPLFRREMACSFLRGEIAFMMGVIVET